VRPPRSAKPVKENVIEADPLQFMPSSWHMVWISRVCWVQVTRPA
jgi:hypothetical protein